MRLFSERPLHIVIIIDYDNNMRTPKAADVLLHPIRLRVVRALAAMPDATVGEISDALGDVPPASLYRHINKLVAVGVIEMSSQRQVRGAVESRYRVAHGSLSASDLRSTSKEDHLRYFVTFVATAIDDFAAYLASGEPDVLRDGVGYRQVPLDLTDAELRRMAAAISAAVAPFVGLPRTKARTPRILSTILMPARRRIQPSSEG
jgi:DNA-binding transcriptional ArsR family regulator